MSLFDYKKSQDIDACDYPFYAIIMAAMLRADSINADKLRAAFPETFEELQARYNAPGGRLEGE